MQHKRRCCCLPNSKDRAVKPAPIPYSAMFPRHADTWGEYLKLSDAEQRDHMRQLVDYWGKVAGMWDAKAYDADTLEDQQNSGQKPL